MLRIDLLPSYVAQRRLTRQLVLLFTVIFTMIVLGMLGVWQPLLGQIATVSKQADDAEANKKKVDDLTQQASTVAALEPPYKNKLTFVTEVHDHNLYYPKLYRTIAAYTVPQILYTSMSVKGTDLAIDAYTPSLASLSDYLAHIWNDPDLKTVSVSAFPGYRQEYDPSKKDFTLPQLPPGYIAHFKNSSQLVKSFTVQGGVVTQIRSGNEQQQEEPTTANSKKPKFDAAHSGFDFSVAAVLKQPVPEPSDPSGGIGGASSAPAGGAGGPGPGGPPPGPGGKKA